MKQTTTRRWVSALLILTMTLALCACSKPGSKKETALDNNPCNNGFFAIMETESGYYMNQWGTQRLRYYDRESGNEIYLCPKPECQHDGNDSCTATYRNMPIVNSVLYDGAIYILSRETEGSTAGYYLYRASLDGSTLDKVGCAFSAENTVSDDFFWHSKQDHCYEGYASMFIIHRGFAYIPFFLAFKYSIMGFVNGGIIKMDLASGKAEQIYQMSGNLDSYPQNLRARGKYVFFDLHVNYRGTFCYDTENGEVFCAFGEDLVNRSMLAETESEDIVYYKMPTQQDDGTWVAGLVPYNITAGEQEPWEQLAEKMIFFDGIDTERFNVMLYEDHFFVSTEDRTGIYDTDGKKLGEIVNPPDGSEPYRNPSNSIYQNPVRFQITNGSLYAVCQPSSRSYTHYLINMYDNSGMTKVYSCPIEDILAGNGAWTLAYTISDKMITDYDSDLISWFLDTYYIKY